MGDLLFSLCSHPSFTASDGPFDLLHHPLLILLELWASLSFALFNAVWPPSQAIGALAGQFWSQVDFPLVSLITRCMFLHLRASLSPMTFKPCENSVSLDVVLRLGWQVTNTCVVAERRGVYVIHTCKGLFVNRSDDVASATPYGQWSVMT